MSAMKALKNPAKHRPPPALGPRGADRDRRPGPRHPVRAHIGVDYVPDFVIPPTTTPFPELEEELELVAGTPVERVRIELDKLVAPSTARSPSPFG